MDEESRKRLCDKAIEGLDKEVCGFILKDGTIVDIPNRSHDPQRMFLMMYSDLIAAVANPHDIVAIWHSHPSGNAKLSKGDVDFIYGMKNEWQYYIVTKAEVVEVDVNNLKEQPDSFWQSFSE